MISGIPSLVCVRHYVCHLARPRQGPDGPVLEILIGAAGTGKGNDSPISAQHAIGPSKGSGVQDRPPPGPGNGSCWPPVGQHRHPSKGGQNASPTVTSAHPIENTEPPTNPESTNVVRPVEKVEPGSSKTLIALIGVSRANKALTMASTSIRPIPSVAVTFVSAALVPLEWNDYSACSLSIKRASSTRCRPRDAVSASAGSPFDRIWRASGLLAGGAWCAPGAGLCRSPQSAAGVRR